MVAAQHEEAVGVGELQRVEVEDTLGGEAAAVDIVAQKEVLRVLVRTANFEQAKQVKVLPVDVAAH